jgi:hypothetical protein
MLTTQDGKSFYPAFTDWGELKKWQSITSPPKTLILSFDDYAAMVLQKEEVEGVVINPFGDNFLMNHQTLTHLKTQKDLNTKVVSQQVITKETKVLLGEPKEYPTEMVQAISDYLKQQPLARRAWLRLMFRDNEQSYLLVVDFSGDKDVLFGAIAGAARPYLNDMYIDMVPYQDSFGRDATEGVNPFYEKKQMPDEHNAHWRQIFMNSPYLHPAAKKIGYSPMKFGCYCSAGLLHEEYVFEILTGICDAP